MIALWNAPDPAAALVAASLLLLGLGAAWVLAWAGRVRQRRATLLGLLGLAATALGAALSGAALLFQDASAVNPNVLAGALALLLALGVPGALWLAAWRARAWRTVALAVWALAWLAGLAALVLTGSRGAWVALGVAALYAATWILRPHAARRWAWGGGLVDALLVAGALMGGAVWLFLLGQGARLGGDLGGRIGLWRDGLALLGDAPFTGSGLRSTMLALSTYVYLLHVGYISHVHNFFLELAVEQGLLGLIAYGFLVLSAIVALVRARRRGVTPVAMQAAVLAALVALLVHGLIDAGLYASRLAPLIFAPIAAAWVAGGRVHGRDLEARGRRVLGAMAPLAAVALLFAGPGARAAWQANLGVVAQTRAELFLYRWPEWPIQDALRRSAEVDLTPAITRYAAALTLDPTHAVASRRLAQIALSRGDIATARPLLENAFAQQPDHPATRLLLGELRAFDGDAAGAAALWAGVNTSMGQLDARRWWIGETGTPEQLAAFDAARAELQQIRERNG